MDQDKFILSDALSKTYDRLISNGPFPCSKVDFKAALMGVWFSAQNGDDLPAELRCVDIWEVKKALSEVFRSCRCHEKFLTRLGEIVLDNDDLIVDRMMECDTKEELRDQQSTQSSPASSEEEEISTEEREITEAQRSDPLCLLYNSKHTQRGRAARKDNFYLKHYRGTKRSIKYFEKEKPFTSNLLRTTAANGTHSVQYSALKAFYEAHSQGLNQWRKDFDEHMQISMIYREELAREYNSVFTDWLYCGTPDDMCKKFKVKCCKGKHTDRCREVWTLVKDYMKNLGM